MEKKMDGERVWNYFKGYNVFKIFSEETVKFL